MILTLSLSIEPEWLHKYRKFNMSSLVLDRKINIEVKLCFLDITWRHSTEFSPLILSGELLITNMVNSDQLRKSSFLTQGKSQVFKKDLLIQVVNETNKRDILLGLLLANKEKKTTGDVKIRGSLGYSDCKIVEFRDLREVYKIKMHCYNLRRANFDMLKGFFISSPWDKALKGGEVQKSCPS